MRAARADCAVTTAATLVMLGVAGPVLAAAGDVASTVHNLSVSGPGEVRAVSETEVCKFCHVPHNAVVPKPLWGHAISTAVYRTAEVTTGRGIRQPAPQPDGSSRLCLSCHDGTVALGELAGDPRPISMSSVQYLGPGRPGHLGTDLTGGHPISFVVSDAAVAPAAPGRDMGVKPLAVVGGDPDVKLDRLGKMQCTTCHDPHSDRYYQPGLVPRFWVKPTVGEVCTTCHELR